MNDNEKISVAVLLATYNGEKYLHELLESLDNQTYKKFELFVSDDKSIDNTISIINNYTKLASYSIKIVNNADQRGSACKNFLYLLGEVESDLYLFCDQDDVWSNNHIEELVNAYNKLENKDKPILIHSDLTVVDSELNVISDSFFKYSNLPIKQDKQLYFLQNNITGCVCLINNKLKEFIFLNKIELQKNINLIPMHDVFMGSIAAYFGKIVFVSTSLIKYRQHEGNVVGAKDVSGIKYIIKKLFQNRENIYTNEYIQFWINYFKNYLSLMDQKQLNDYIKIQNGNRIKRNIFLMKNNFLKTGLIRKLGQLIF